MRIQLSRKAVFGVNWQSLGETVMLYRSGAEVTRARSASEGCKLFPRLRFGLVCNVSNLAGSGMYRDRERSFP